MSSPLSPVDSSFDSSEAVRADILKAVHEISIDDLDALSPQVEAAADSTPLIDHWCSGPDWQIPVSLAFAPQAERLILATDTYDGFAMLSKYDGEHTMFGGMEPLWGFGTPIVGRNPQSIATEVATVLASRDDWETVFLPGMPLLDEPSEAELATSPDDDDPNDDDHSDHRDDNDDADDEAAVPGRETPSPTWRPRPDPTVTLGIAHGLSSLGQVGLTYGITRRIADLRPDPRAHDASGSSRGMGYDQWLARRTARFRRNLRQAMARADSEGLTIEDGAHDPELFDRLMAIEHQTWKGIDGSGITSVEMGAMYEAIINRLRKSGRLQVFIARHRNTDAGYILGGTRQRRYRGLQLSYTEETRHLSVGNLLQNHQLKQLAIDDLADTYDLGMDFEYKKRWADSTKTTATLVVHRQR